MMAPRNARPPPTNSHGFVAPTGSLAAAGAAEGLGRLGAPAPDGRAPSLASVADVDGVGRADLDGVAEAVCVAPGAAGVPLEIGGPKVGPGPAVGLGGFGVGAALGVGVGAGGIAVAGGVGTGVGVAVGAGPITMTVGPMSVGSPPWISATKVTCQVPAGSVEEPVQVPSVVVPAVRASPIEAGPTMAVTELAACCALVVT
jgi:hypothetical protein